MRRQAILIKKPPIEEVLRYQMAAESSARVKVEIKEKWKRGGGAREEGKKSICPQIFPRADEKQMSHEQSGHLVIRDAAITHAPAINTTQPYI